MMRRIKMKFMCRLFCFLVIAISCPRTEAAAPAFAGLPTSVTIGESEITDRIIYSLTVTDADGDAFNCDITGTTPVSAPFRVLKDTDLNRFEVFTFNPSPGNTMFDYAVTTLYLLTIQCDDNTGNTPTAVLSVDIYDNALMTITNLPTTVTLDASTTLTNVGVADPDYTYTITPHPTVTFSMFSNPSTTSFQIDPTTGNITTARDLKYETNSGIDLYVTVTDGTISVRGKMRVQLTNLNYIPEFINTVASIDVLENTAIGTLLTTLTSYDADAGAILSYTMAVSPAADASKFSLNTGNLQLSSAQTFDFETTTTYTLTFTISDTIATSTPYVLTVNIINVDEPCYFDKSIYYISLTEGNAGSTVVDPGFVINDYDGTSTSSLSLLAGNNSERFNMASSTGVVTFALNYDVDNSAMASSVIVTCVCTDPTGLTGTALLYITVNDDNDNAPTFPQASYVLYADQLTTPGSLLGSITPTDADSGSNALVSCSGTVTSALTNTYYSVGSNCGIYLTANPSGSLNYGQTIRFLVTAVDQGTTPQSGSTTVDVVFRETSTTTTTTTAAPDTNTFWDDPGSVAVFCISLILGLLLAAALLYLCIRFCYTGMCCGPDPFDFCDCCNRSRDCCRPSSRASRRVVDERPPSKKDEFTFRREDTLNDFGGKQIEEPRRTPMVHGPREYKDFPQSSRLTPTDVQIAYPMAVVSRGYY